MISTPLCIKSDFSDFYDTLSSPNGIVYNRQLSDCRPRGSALKYLRSLGIKTIDLKQVSSFSYLDEKLVVYTDPKKHNGQGKKICSYEEALSMYPNFLATKYIENNRGFTVKYLQIGKKRYNLTFKKYDESLEIGRLVDIAKLTDDFNIRIGIPIFSIDYIEINSAMIATDFNEVQNLEQIGINNYIAPHVICNEIAESLILYNKVERNN